MLLPTWPFNVEGFPVISKQMIDRIHKNLDGHILTVTNHQTAAAGVPQSINQSCQFRFWKGRRPRFDRLRCHASSLRQFDLNEVEHGTIFIGCESEATIGIAASQGYTTFQLYVIGHLGMLGRWNAASPPGGCKFDR